MDVFKFMNFSDTENNTAIEDFQVWKLITFVLLLQWGLIQENLLIGLNYQNQVIMFRIYWPFLYWNQSVQYINYKPKCVCVLLPLHCHSFMSKPVLKEPRKKTFENCSGTWLYRGSYGVYVHCKHWGVKMTPVGVNRGPHPQLLKLHPRVWT